LYLVDTNVISAGAPSKRAAPPGLVEWIDCSSDSLFLSVVTTAEVEAGIAKARREGAATKAAALSAWWDAIEHLYGDRILPVGLDVGHAVGRLLDKARAAGHTPDFAGVAIAATAEVHDLTILTRNVKHFAPFGIPLANPFDNLPPLASGMAP
jgi:predicted nucleic acid-binding protein